MAHISIPASLAATQNRCAYNEKAKAAFHKEGKTFLRAVAKALGLTTDQYDLRSNLAGIAVSGEVTLHTDLLYAQLSESCIGPGGPVILFRRCKGRKDYVGETNHFVPAAELRNAEKQSRFIRTLKDWQDPA